MDEFEHPLVATMFNRENLSGRCLGRRSPPTIKKSTAHRTAIILGVLMLGIATGATAVAVKRHSHAPQTGFVGQNLPANIMRDPNMGGFAEAFY